MMQPGLSAEVTFSVTPELTAKTVGSGTLDVLATPVMIAKMEQAAWTAVASVWANLTETVLNLDKYRALLALLASLDILKTSQVI